MRDIRQFLTVMNGGGDPTSLSLDFSTLPDGAIPGMLGATWSVSSGVAINNPTIGAELLSNPSFDANTTGWAVQGCTIASVAGGQTNNCLEITRVSGTSQGARSTITTVADNFYLLSVYIKSGSSGNQLSLIRLAQTASPFAEDGNCYQNSTANWALQRVVMRASQTSTLFWLWKVTDTAGTMLFDTASAKRITGLVPSVKKFASQYGAVKAFWTAGASTAAPMGVVMCADYPTFSNYVVAYHDNLNTAGAVRMFKVVNGTWTSLVNTAATYYPDVAIELERDPGTNTFRVKYNGVQVGADQTIADAGIINNQYHGLYDISPQLDTCAYFGYTNNTTRPVYSFIGDSIMITGRWPFHHFTNTWHRVINHAVSGETIITHMDAQVVAAASDGASKIFIGLGTNDDNAGNMATLRAEIEENIDELRASNASASLYWINVLPRWTDVGGGTEVDKSNIRAAIAASCAAKGVTCWDTYTDPWITSADTTDGLHPNDTGRAKIAARILALLG